MNEWQVDIPENIHISCIFGSHWCGIGWVRQIKSTQLAFSA